MEEDHSDGEEINLIFSRLGPEIDSETCNYVVSKNRRSIEILWVSENTIEGETLT